MPPDSSHRDSLIAEIQASRRSPIGSHWILNRRWAWRIRGSLAVGREIVGYIAVSVLALIASSLATGWTNARAQSVPGHHAFRVVFVTASYVAVQAALFAATFVMYEHWIFSGRSRVRAGLRHRRHGWASAPTGRRRSSSGS